MKKRQYLEPKQTIDLRIRNDSADFKRTFTIREKIKEGAFTVCYEAGYAGSGYGVLKEFYPEEAYVLERDASAQLVMTEGLRGEQEKFLEDEANYLKPYEMLLNLKRSGDNPDLSTFIPNFEIYQGCDREGNFIGSVYVWTPEPKLETFDKICDDIHKNPKKEPEEKLVTVLNAIKSLTECICILHSEGIIHRDIKPSNFGFKKRGDQILYQTIELFDVNSVCSVYNKENELVETKGYLEPEGKIKKATNQTDIYAIGATLFSAIVVTDETRKNDFIYQPEEYDRLHELILNSDLIRDSENNTHPSLIAALTRILRNSLCDRGCRYENCEQMLEDLEDALFYALPTEIALKQRAGQKWVLKDVEKSFDADREKNSALAICCHLYEHPLYQCVRDTDPVVDVLVIGFGNYGQKFMDVCLQVGQIRDKGLHVIVLSDKEEDKENYLTDRPVLPEFFNIDGSLDPRLTAGELSDQDVYGSIEFQTERLQRDDPQGNARILKKIMDAYQAKNQQPNYVFIALGDDALNAAAANACKKAVDAYGWDCLVNYACESEKAAGKSSLAEGKLSLYMGENVKGLSLYPQMERMAFNTHLVWEKNLDIDYHEVQKEFHDPYNHNSSVANVLSIKYKLHSVGIDMESGGYNTKAAKRFRTLLEDPANEKIKNELVWVEHRRWVTEKLCQGWNKKEVQSCSDGLTKDEEHRQHICLVRSRPEPGLDNWDHDRWDDLRDQAALQELDELDRMSVQLHRAYGKKAKMKKKQGLLSDDSGILTEIRSLIEENRATAAAFEAWLACMIDILNGDTQKVNLYEGFKDSFLSAAETLPTDKKQTLTGQIRSLDREFLPILESMRYRNWKQDDIALTEQIPFILTYDENLHMVIPFTTGSISDLFKNVGAATVANPREITYLCFLSGKKDLDTLLQSVPGVLEYMKKKKLRARVCFWLCCEDSQDIEDLKARFQEETGCKAADIQCVTGTKKRELPEKLTALLLQKNSKKDLLPVTEKNGTGFSNYLDGAGFYDAFPCYRFDDRTMKFTSLLDCDLLEYIHKKPFMTVDEMLTLSGARSAEQEQPEFYADYKQLWERYSQDKEAWKSLCSCLKNYAGQNDLLAQIPIREKTGGKQGGYEYMLPFACKNNVTMILDFLKEKDVIKGYGVRGYTSDSCRVFINGPQVSQKWFDVLFSKVTELMIPDAVTAVYSTKDKEIRVEFDNMTVTGMPVGNSDKTLQKRVLDLADYLYEKKYLINLKEEEGKLSFTYATRQVKELLTKEGKMLEIYVYHKVKEQSEFDDVVSGYEFSWKQEGVKNECDCILTKGFQTLIVECKARPKLDQNFYYKLETLTGHILVNAKAVLVTDTGEPADQDLAEENAVQRRRGEGMEITTIWKEKDIENIGETLNKVIEGRFDSAME